MKPVFDTDKRIRLGIWGLGRGATFVKSAAALNIDVVAGCDLHPHMREEFKKNVPGAFVTADEDELLAYDIDAVLIATYLPDHAKHAIKALNAGKHVMCEVTSFLTLADGVELVEAVEKSGKVYNLLENYPFTKENMYLRKLYEDGFFGEFQYGEFEYVHECRGLTYAYNVGHGLPIEPGYTLHSWRSGLNYHLYNTHSLGPLMQITGLRPVSVTAPKNSVYLDGTMPAGRATSVAASLITMSNGGTMRNLMGTTTNDYHRNCRFWGTRAGAENINGLRIRVGASGYGVMLDMQAEWPELKEHAEAAGHAGGDFWELYYFAREVLTGEPAPWNIYAAADVTAAGIQAARSMANDAALTEIPDFRKQEDRDRYRNDHWDPRNPAWDPMRIFPEGHDPAITGNFNSVMLRLFPLHRPEGLNLAAQVYDGMKIFEQISSGDQRHIIVERGWRLVQMMPEIAEACRAAKVIADAYPDSVPGQMIHKLLEREEVAKVLDTEKSLAELQEWLRDHY